MSSEHLAAASSLPASTSSPLTSPLRPPHHHGAPMSPASPSRSDRIPAPDPPTNAAADNPEDALTQALFDDTDLLAVLNTTTSAQPTSLPNSPSAPHTNPASGPAALDTDLATPALAPPADHGPAEHEEDHDQDDDEDTDHKANQTGKQQAADLEQPLDDDLPKQQPVRRTKKRKMDADLPPGVPDRPKRPLSAYLLFMRQNYKTLQSELIALGRPATLGQVGKYATVRFSGMNPEEKQHYDTLAEQDHERYRREVTAWETVVKQARAAAGHSSAVSFPSGRPRSKGAPTRPPSAYNLFMKEKYDEIRALHPESAGKTMTKHIAEAWRNASDVERKYFEERAAQAKAEFDRNRAAGISPPTKKQRTSKATASSTPGPISPTLSAVDAHGQQVPMSAPAAAALATASTMAAAQTAAAGHQPPSHMSHGNPPQPQSAPPAPVQPPSSAPSASQAPSTQAAPIPTQLPPHLHQYAMQIGARCFLPENGRFIAGILLPGHAQDLLDQHKAAPSFVRYWQDPQTKEFTVWHDLELVAANCAAQQRQQQLQQQQQQQQQVYAQQQASAAAQAQVQAQAAAQAQLQAQQQQLYQQQLQAASRESSVVHMRSPSWQPGFPSRSDSTSHHHHANAASSNATPAPPSHLDPASTTAPAVSSAPATYMAGQTPTSSSAAYTAAQYYQAQAQLQQQQHGGMNLTPQQYQQYQQAWAQQFSRERSASAPGVNPAIAQQYQAHQPLQSTTGRGQQQQPEHMQYTGSQDARYHAMGAAGQQPQHQFASPPGVATHSSSSSSSPPNVASSQLHTQFVAAQHDQQHQMQQMHAQYHAAVNGHSSSPRPGSTFPTPEMTRNDPGMHSGHMNQGHTSHNHGGAGGPYTTPISGQTTPHDVAGPRFLAQAQAHQRQVQQAQHQYRQQYHQQPEAKSTESAELHHQPGAGQGYYQY